MLIVFTLIDSKYKDASAFEAFLVAYFLGSFVHTFVARSAYIQKLLQQENEEEEYYRQRQVSGMGYAGSNRTEQFANQYNTRRNSQVEGSGNANTQRTTTTEKTDHTTVNTSPRQTAATAGSATPVDINSCTLTEMTALPGINIVMAKQAVKYRYEHGGFSSFDEFAEVVKLKPHFIVQLQDLVMCKPIDAQSQQSSAQQQPEKPGPEHHGRRLDL